MESYINNGKNLRDKPVGLSTKNEQMAFCSNLPLGFYLFQAMKTLSQRILFLLMQI